MHWTHVELKENYLLASLNGCIQPFLDTQVWMDRNQQYQPLLPFVVLKAIRNIYIL